MSDRVVDTVLEGLMSASGSAPRGNEHGRAQARDISRVICAAPEYLARRGVPQTPDELHGTTAFVPLGVHRTSHRLGAASRRAGFDRSEGSVTLNDLLAVGEAAVAGLGLAQLPAFIAAPHIRSGRLLPVLEGYSTASAPLVMFYPPRHRMAAQRSCIHVVHSRTPREPPGSGARRAPDGRLSGTRLAPRRRRYARRWIDARLTCARASACPRRPSSPRRRRTGILSVASGISSHRACRPGAGTPYRAALFRESSRDRRRIQTGCAGRHRADRARPGACVEGVPPGREGDSMTIGITRRRVIGALVVLALVGGLAGTVALRASKRANRRRTGGQGAPVAAAVRAGRPRLRRAARRCRAGCRCPARCSRCARRSSRRRSPATCARSPCARAKPVRPGRCSRASTPPTCESRLVDRIGALESARAQLALAEKTRVDERAAAERQVHLAERVRQRRVELQRRAGQREVGRGAGAARAERARRTRRSIAPLSGIVAKRHVQPGEKVAIEAPLVTIVDLTDLEVQAMVPAIDVPELRDRHAGRARRRRLRRAPLHRPRRAHQPVDRARHARDPRLRQPAEPRRRAARRHVRDRPHRARGERAGADAAGRRGAHRGRARRYVWAIDNGKLVAAHRHHSAAATTTNGRIEIKTALPAQTAGARRALRQPEGRRAGAREGADVVAERHRDKPRRRRLSRSARRARRARAAPEGPSPCGSPARRINNPVFATMVMIGITVLGALLVPAAARRADAGRRACRSSFILTQLPGRVARGGRDRRHQADRVRGQPGVAASS